MPPKPSARGRRTREDVHRQLTELTDEQIRMVAHLLITAAFSACDELVEHRQASAIRTLMGALAQVGDPRLF